MSLTSKQIELLNSLSIEELKSEIRRRNKEEREKLGIKRGPKYAEFEGVVRDKFVHMGAFKKTTYRIRSDAFGANTHFEYSNFPVNSTFFTRKGDMPNIGDTVKLRVLNGRALVEGKIIGVIKRAEEK